MAIVLRNEASLPKEFQADALDRLVDCLLNDFLAASPICEAHDACPLSDVFENETAFEVHVELPGVARDGIKTSISGQTIYIEAEVMQCRSKQSDMATIFAERHTRKFARSLTLPLEIDQTRAEAQLENGILILTLPKKRCTGTDEIPSRL